MKDEKGVTADVVSVVEREEKNMYDATEHLATTHEGDHGIRRDLPPRVVSMIAIAGTIGTGLFLSSGAALTTGGPVGAWIGYTAMGMAVGCMMYCLVSAAGPA
jgi:amino acid transporter